MKLIGEHVKPDIALLPIGGTFTMDVRDAAIAASYCSCTKVIGLHYDTFDPIRIDHVSAIRDFAASGIELKLLGIGESYSNES
jgi:L-ascorbate metabolism protein UlaG (beta-lactamase superfamily)